VLIGFSILSTGLLVYYWPSPDCYRENYYEFSIYSALEEVNIENVTYYLEVHLSRDFMPIVPSGGPPLYTLIIIHAVGVAEFPSTISVKRIWLIKCREISRALPTDYFQVYGNRYEMFFDDGPKWETGISIDVVVRLIGPNSTYYYLTAENQLIHRRD